MIKKILDAIAEALFQKFGSNYEIYTEKVEQGLDGNCFTIRCLNPMLKCDLKQRFKENLLFSVQYFPTSTTDNTIIQECTEVLEKLFDTLPDIKVDGKVIHADQLQGQITDDVLTFTVTYNLFVLKIIDPAVDMGDLTVKSEAKG